MWSLEEGCLKTGIDSCSLKATNVFADVMVDGSWIHSITVCG